MGQVWDSFASLRQPSLDFVFVSFPFRQPFVVFRQISFNDRESGLFKDLRASDAGKTCEPEGPAAVASPALPEGVVATRMTSSLAPSRGLFADETKHSIQFGFPKAFVANRRKMVIRQGVAGKEEV